MKLKNGKKGEVSITEFEKGLDDWADKVLEVTDFPIVTRTMKGVSSKYKTVWCPSRFDRMAEIIKDKNKFTRKEFPTISDVYRAALYVGFRLIYRRFKKDFPTDHALHSLDKTLEVMEEDYINHQCLSWNTHAIKRLLQCRRVGTIDPERYEQKIEAVINSAPECLRELLRENRKKLESGGKVTDLYNTSYQSWGGQREGAGRKG